jgi:hypothetical protein
MPTIVNVIQRIIGIDASRAAPILRRSDSEISETPCIRGCGQNQLLPVASIDENGSLQTTPRHAAPRQ